MPNLQVAFPLVLDTYEFCSEALKKQLDGPREAARADADRAAGLEKAAKVRPCLLCREKPVNADVLMNSGLKESPLWAHEHVCVGFCCLIENPAHTDEAGLASRRPPSARMGLAPMLQQRAPARPLQAQKRAHPSPSPRLRHLLGRQAARRCAPHLRRIMHQHAKRT